jgi:general stress protein YciG
MGTRKNAAAVALGRKGGKARLTKLTPEERSEIARKAGKASAKVRWGKKAD